MTNNYVYCFDCEIMWTNQGDNHWGFGTIQEKEISLFTIPFLECVIFDINFNMYVNINFSHRFLPAYMHKLASYVDYKKIVVPLSMDQIIYFLNQ